MADGTPQHLDDPHGRDDVLARTVFVLLGAGVIAFVAAVFVFVL